MDFCLKNVSRETFTLSNCFLNVPRGAKNCYFTKIFDKNKTKNKKSINALALFAI